MNTRTHLLCMALCGLLATTGAAATETYSGVAVDGVGPQAADRQVDLDGGALSAATGYQGMVGYNSDPFTITDKVADVSRSAESELAAGRLATVTKAAFGAQISGPDLALGTATLYSRASAWMGDRFTLALGDGSPFSSIGGGTVTFSFDLTGEITVSGPFVAGEGYSQLSTGFFFGAYRTGALDLWRQYDDALQNMDFDTANTLYAQIQGLEITTSRALFLDAVTAQRQDYLDSMLPVDVYVPDAETPTVIDVAFDAPDTFEWLVMMQSVAELDASLSNTAVSADFGNTLLARFSAGDDVVAYSSSGLFPGTAPLPAIPEPATVWMLLAGACVVVLAVRRTTTA